MVQLADRRPPRIPPRWLHPADQRALALALFALLQAAKASALLAASPPSLPAWAPPADAAFVLLLALLRIPRLSWRWPVHAVALVLLVGGLDWALLAGGWRAFPFAALVPSSLSAALTFYPTLSASHARLPAVLRPADHLAGAFELVVTPPSTARLLGANDLLPCLPRSSPSSGGKAKAHAVPVALHFSTPPGIIEYALTSPASHGGATVLRNVSASALERVRPRRTLAGAHGDDDDDEEDDDDDEFRGGRAGRQAALRHKLAREALALGSSSSSAGAAGSSSSSSGGGGGARDGAGEGVTLLLPIDMPGTVRLSRVFPPAAAVAPGGGLFGWGGSKGKGGGGGGGHTFRVPLKGNEGVRVWECPTAAIVPHLRAAPGGPVQVRESERCVGEDGRLELVVTGEGGVRVGWASVDGAGRRESGVLEGIGLDDAAAAAAAAAAASRSDDDDDAAAAAAVGVAKSYLVPLPLTFPSPGRKTYTLTSLATPHTPPLALDPARPEHRAEFTVLPRPAVGFDPSLCAAGEPVELLDPRFAPDRPQGALVVLNPTPPPTEGYTPFAELSFTPPGGAPQPARLALAGPRVAVPLAPFGGPGTFELAAVGLRAADGREARCKGDVKEPSACAVVYAPVPAVVGFDVRKLEDDCAGEQGVTASLRLTGQPPFVLTYTLTLTPPATAADPHPAPRAPQRKTVRIPGPAHELVLRPDDEGAYVYALDTLADAKYTRGVDVQGQVEGSVRPVATADFNLRASPRAGGKPAAAVAAAAARREVTVHACEPHELALEIDIRRGRAPFELEFLATTALAAPASGGADGNGGSHAPRAEVLKRTFATDGRHALVLPLPPALAERAGGSYTVVLTAVRDGSGCQRALDTRPVTAIVRTGRPTARIASPGGGGGGEERAKAVVREGQDVSVPLRLTGDAPWAVVYTRSDAPGREVRQTVGVPNTDFVFRDAATYTLVSVEDAHCKGTIVPGQASFTIEHLPRPSVRLLPDVAALAPSSSASGGTVARKAAKSRGVCVGEPDQLALQFTGKPPFAAHYTVAKHGKGLLPHRDAARTLSAGAAAGDATVVPLDTSEPGRFTYALDQVADANYPALAPVRPGQAFEHEVYGRPSARWLSTEPVALCAHATLDPAALSPGQGTLLLKGKAPFTVTLHIQTAKAAHPAVRTIGNIKSDEWRVAVPDYAFDTLGRYAVSIASVADATGCAQDEAADGAAEGRTFEVEVAETASVVQVQKGEDVCVGQSLDFLLQGSPPWSLTTEWNGKSQRLTSRDSHWSRLADRPGTFSLTSISHARNRCQTPVTDVVRRVHALPAARISAGKSVVETVEEGEQAEIVFSFEGEPPFSLTYTRSTKGRLPQVLESHTVSGIQEHEYSIFASSEGVWQVTEIEDRWCRFPPHPSANAAAKPASLLEGIELFPPLAAP